MTEIEKIEGEIKVLQAKLELLKEIEKHKSPAEEAFKRVYCRYPDMEHNANSFSIFQKGYNAAYEEKVEEEPKPVNEVLDRLENKYKDAEENAASYMTDEVVNRMLKKWEENPPDFLKFELGKTLEGLISDWMDDCVPAYSTWDYELGIAILIRRIEKWLPDFQSHEGTQSASVIDLVDGYNDALTKIKSKLRNKKDT
jgi:hypothetical protein